MTINDLPQRLRDIPGIVIAGTEKEKKLHISDSNMKVLEQVNLPLLDRKEKPA